MLGRLVLSVTACFGLALAGHTAEIFPRQSDWRYFVGTTEASSPDTTAWRMPGFDDSGWAIGQTPIGYGVPDIATDLGRSRDAGYLTVYLRKEFEIANPADFTQLNLEIRIDDGYVVWINGIEVGRFNVPDGELAHDSTSITYTLDPEDTTLTVPDAATLLREGTNWIAVHVLNVNWTSSDLYFDAAMSAVPDDTPPVVLELHPPAFATIRHLSTIEIQFNKPVQGVDAEDLLIHGVPATSLTLGEPGQFVFGFPEPEPGVVQVTWAADHGITDLTSAARPFDGGTWTYTLDPDSTGSGMMISEFMAANRLTLNDDDGDRSDWIELHNAGAFTEHLDGWFLTDDPDDLTQWRFPSVTMLPRTYLVVFASGKDRTDPNVPLHTNFRLARDGEYLALVDPRTNIVSEFAPAYPVQFEDVSYGRDRLDPGITGYFLTPTPGQPNAVSGAGFAPMVWFSPAGGTFLEEFALELTTASPDAQIRYTLDGSFPTESSPLYAEPIPITTTSRVRARAFQPGLLPGTPTSEHYIHVEPSLADFTSNLPLVVIDNFGAGSIPASPVTERQFAAVAIFEPGTDGRSSLLDTPALSSPAGFNIRGSSTKNFPKSSYRLEFWDEYGEDRNVPVLGMPEEDDWVLYAPNLFDLPLIHNPFIFQLSNDIGRYAPRTRLVELFVNTRAQSLRGPISSGNYRGIYVLMENIKRDSKRVPLDRLEPEHTDPPEVTGGYLLKVDRVDPDERTFNAAGMRIIYQYPKGLEMVSPQRSAQATYIRNYFDAFGSALNSPRFQDPHTGYAAYIDVDSWIDHHILNVLALNVDALRLSAYFHKPREDKIHMGPIWDFDRSMGTSQGGDRRPFNPRTWMASSPLGGGNDYGTDFFNPINVFHNPWYSRLFTDPDFWQRWIDRYQELRTARFSREHLFHLVDSLADQLREAQPRDLIRWRGAGPSDPTPRSGTVSVPGYSHAFPGTYQGEIDFMKRWLADRIDFIDSNFLPPPRLSHPDSIVDPGFVLSLLDQSDRAGTTLYYTLDGSDPRAPGGDIAPTAIPYTGPINLQQSARLSVRAHNPEHSNLTGPRNPPISSPWSGPVTATYLVDPAMPVINEIMYQPAVPDTEFLELHNPSATESYLLCGHRLRGVDLNFPDGTILPPGGFLLLVKNRTAFEAHYGTGLPIAGEYNGRLHPDGERLRLVRLATDTEDELILDEVTYGTTPPWPAAANGLGPSLQRIDPTHSSRHPGNWIAVSPTADPALQSTPGAPNSVQTDLPPFPDLKLNELQPVNRGAFVDHAGQSLPWLELYNAGSEPIQLDGFHLTDVMEQPDRWAFPPDATLLPGEFQIVWFLDTNTSPAPTAWHADLPIDPSSGSLFLTRRVGSVNTLIDHLPYHSVAPGWSWGRYPDGNPEKLQIFHFPSPGRPNDNTSIPVTVWINEWMASNSGTIADPLDGEFKDWIELYNPSPYPVDLSSYTLTDRLYEPDRFTIPNGTIIQPNGHLLVWTDGKPELNSLNNEIHTNFRLSIDGEAIGLFAPDGSLVDALTFGPQTTDISQGRWPDGAPPPFHFFETPTPGAPNLLPMPPDDPDPAYPTPGSVLVNEWMADNATTIADPADGQYKNWFELHNPGPHPVDLSGCTISDHLDNPTRWTVPDGTIIEPGGFLFIWASGTPELTEITGQLHANFRLSRSGEAIGLYTPDLTVVDLVIFGPQETDVSQGRWPDGHPAPFHFFSRPTPAAPNFLEVDPAPVHILGIQPSADGVDIVWSTTPGQRYQVQYKDSLFDPEWTVLIDELVATNFSLTILDNSTADQPERYYRIIRLDPHSHQPHAEQSSEKPLNWPLSKPSS